MTKPREPVTIENTLRKVLGILTIERAAEVTSRSVSYLHALTDPLKRERLTIEDAIALDIEHRAAGHQGYPLTDTMLRILECSGHARFADDYALGTLTFSFVKEAGEASAALVAAMQPGATVQCLETALGELEQADAAAAPTIAHLQKRIKRARDGPTAHPPDG